AMRVWYTLCLHDALPIFYAGGEDAAIFKSTDGAKSWNELAGLRAADGDKWQPGAGGLCLHTILIGPSNPDRIFVAISAAGAFRRSEEHTSDLQSRDTLVC